MGDGAVAACVLRVQRAWGEVKNVHDRRSKRIWLVGNSIRLANELQDRRMDREEPQLPVAVPSSHGLENRESQPGRDQVPQRGNLPAWYRTKSTPLPSRAHRRTATGRAPWLLTYKLRARTTRGTRCRGTISGQSDSSDWGNRNEYKVCNWVGHRGSALLKHRRMRIGAQCFVRRTFSGHEYLRRFNSSPNGVA
jgi:hypothetical protein